MEAFYLFKKSYALWTEQTHECMFCLRAASCPRAIEMMDCMGIFCKTDFFR